MGSSRKQEEQAYYVLLSTVAGCTEGWGFWKWFTFLFYVWIVKRKMRKAARVKKVTDRIFRRKDG